MSQREQDLKLSIEELAAIAARLQAYDDLSDIRRVVGYAHNDLTLVLQTDAGEDPPAGPWLAVEEEAHAPAPPPPGTATGAATTAAPVNVTEEVRLLSLEVFEPLTSRGVLERLVAKFPNAGIKISTVFTALNVACRRGHFTPIGTDGNGRAVYRSTSAPTAEPVPAEVPAEVPAAGAGPALGLDVTGPTVEAGAPARPDEVTAEAPVAEAPVAEAPVAAEPPPAEVDQTGMAADGAAAAAAGGDGTHDRAEVGAAAEVPVIRSKHLCAQCGGPKDGPLPNCRRCRMSAAGPVAMGAGGPND